MIKIYQVTKQWIEVYDQSEGNYYVNKEIRIKTSMLRSVYVTLMMYILLQKEILLLLKKYLLPMILKPLIIQ